MGNALVWSALLVAASEAGDEAGVEAAIRVQIPIYLGGRRALVGLNGVGWSGSQASVSAVFTRGREQDRMPNSRLRFV